MNSPFPQLVPPTPSFGSPFFVAPSNNGFNQVAPTPASLVPLIILAEHLRDEMMALQSLLDNDIPGAVRDISVALAGTRAIAGVADAMADSLVFRPQLLPDIAAKCRTFRTKALDLMSSAFATWSDSKADARRLLPDLEAAVHQRVDAIVGMWRDRTNVANIRTFTEDTTVPAPVRFVNLWSLQTLQTVSVDLVTRAGKGDEVDRICKEVFDAHDEAQSTQAITIAKYKTLWDAFVSAAATAGGSVGNLPAPDSLSMALLKVYATIRLPKAALNGANAGALDRELTSYLFQALKLTPAQDQDLRGRLDDLKKAQAEVIRTRENQARDEARFHDGHSARQARKARQRDAAEAASKEKARKVSAFYEETYGVENEELYGTFQRGLGIDVFCSFLAVIQLVAAYKELSDPDVSTLQKAFDVSVNTVLSLGAIVSTVGRALPEVDLGVTKVNLAAFGKFAEALGPSIARFCGAIALIAGGIQVWDGYETHDPGQITLGALSVVSGLGIILGTLAAFVGPVIAAIGTGVGVGIGVLLLAYGAFRAFLDAIKSETEKAIESILTGLEKAQTWRGTSVIDVLKITVKVSAVRSALEGWDCLALLPNPQGGSPTVADLVTRIVNLGFNAKDAKEMVDDPANAPAPLLLLPM